MRDLWLRLATLLHRGALHLLLWLRTRYRFTALLRRAMRDLRLRPLLLAALYLRLALLLLLLLLRMCPFLSDGAVLLLRTLLLLRACL